MASALKSKKHKHESRTTDVAFALDMASKISEHIGIPASEMGNGATLCLILIKEMKLLHAAPVRIDEVKVIAGEDIKEGSAVHLKDGKLYAMPNQVRGKLQKLRKLNENDR